MFAELATTSAAVGATRSRLAKRALLATAIRAADAGEIGLVVTYLSGSLRQRRTGVGLEFTVVASVTRRRADPDRAGRRCRVRADRGDRRGGLGGGAGRRRSQALFARATEAEQRLLRGLVFDEIRQGALDSLVQDGLAEAFGVPAAAVQRASMLLGSTAAAARLLVAEGLDGLQAVGLQVGVPVRPMLAASAPDPVRRSTSPGCRRWWTPNWTASASRCSKDGPVIRLYTRTLDDITDRLPEVVRVVADLPARRLVLDGEVLALGADGRPVAFQLIASRTMTKNPGDGDRLPLALFCFDLLHVDGRDLLDEPLSERVAVMASVLPDSLIVPRTVAADVAAVEAAFARAVSAGFEGAVVKKLTASYAAGRRDSGWIKLKPRHTFDLAVIAAEWGYGRRAGLAVQSAPGRPRPRHRCPGDARQDLQGSDRRDAHLADRTVPGPGGPADQEHRVRRPAAGRRDRVRRGAGLHPLPRRRRPAVRPGAALPGRQVGGRGGHDRRDRRVGRAGGSGLTERFRPCSTAMSWRPSTKPGRRTRAFGR